jgi:hypothetical protein
MTFELAGVCASSTTCETSLAHVCFNAACPACFYLLLAIFLLIAFIEEIESVCCDHA